jgi:hypothetical protein
MPDQIIRAQLSGRSHIDFSGTYAPVTKYFQKYLDRKLQSILSEFHKLKLTDNSLSKMIQRAAKDPNANPTA